MVILERPIGSAQWIPMYDYILRRLTTQRFHRVQGTQVVHVYGADSTRTYAVLSNEPETLGLPVSWVYLWKRPGWSVWEVYQAWTFPDWRRGGLALQIYKAIINRERLLLASGKTQSKSARAFWSKLIEHKTFNIWAQDFNDLDLRSQVLFEDDEVHCNLELYTRWRTKQDVRLVAARK